MNWAQLFRGLIVLVLFGMTPLVRGGEYVDPSNFSLIYPEGWVELSRDAINTPQTEKFQEWLAQNQFDLNRVAVMLLRESDSDYYETLNVVVSEQEIPVNENSLNELREATEQQFAEAGVRVSDFSGRITKFAGKQAVLFDYESQLPGIPIPLRQMQAIFPGGGRTYVVTCTAKTTEFEKHRATFEQMLTQFSIPRPLQQDSYWGRMGARVLIGAVVGGLIGGISWLVNKFSRKATAP